MADLSTTDALFWTGTPTSPSGVSNVTAASTVVDTNTDDNIDSVDYYDDPNIGYSGTTITIDGNEYAVFFDSGAGISYIPYDSSIDDISGSTNTAAWTINATGDDAVVSNCFLTGTLVATPEGERAVENLSIDDLIETTSGDAVKVKWIGRQTMRKTVNLDMTETRAPVCIRAGALDVGVPRADLYITADHALLIDDMLVNAGALVNHDTIQFVPLSEMPAEFTYYHIETEAHDVICANGAAAETFIDYAGRQAFDNAAEYEALYGCERIIPEMNRVRISAQRLLPDTLKQRLGIEVDQRENQARRA
ncbi:MAG: Hint domain-containing protein [Pseudomonadota bacterium]